MYQCDNMLMWQLAALYSAWHICTLAHYEALLRYTSGLSSGSALYGYTSIMAVSATDAI